ncbi:phosphodiester glycosidase family protein [Desulfosporosinus sp. FKA]|uniref:phosphodiester glycosidase family protein n=1 Tax=Desulfosporosinus sp. FKA TaxID=1969834 RepID=UPI000B49A553|nr:phosphodiester glycosidase family protein [Desulfosporosinus sp. FKA]
MNNSRVLRINGRRYKLNLKRFLLTTLIFFSILGTIAATSIQRINNYDPVTPINLSKETARQFIQLLDSTKQYHVSSNASNNTPPIYALGNNGIIKKILVNARKVSKTNQIYVFRTPYQNGRYSITLPPESLSNGPQVNDSALTMAYPFMFYVSSFNGQPQSINAYNLQNNKKNIFAFSNVVKNANILPVNKNQVKVRLVENAGKTAKVFLTINKNTVSSSSPNDLQYMAPPSDNTSPFIRLVEGVKRIMGNSTVAFLENTWYQTKDFITNLFYSTKKRNQHNDSTRSGGTATADSQKQVLPISKIPPQTLPVSDNSPPLVKSIVYPDPSRSYIRVSLVKINPKLVGFHLAAGTKDPVSVTGIHGTGMIPMSVQRQNNLIGDFNAGFQARDGVYGFMADNQIYQLPKIGLATFCIYKDGKIDIGSWGKEISSTTNMISLRQNLPMLIDNGKLNPLISDQAKWGATVNNAVRVWRSGIGIDGQGKIIYAAGNNLTAETLAHALLSAGSIRAMELDINSYWVTFNFLNHASGSSNGSLVGTKLDPSMTRSPYRYLSPDTRDFFYLTLKTPAHPS